MEFTGRIIVFRGDLIPIGGYAERLRKETVNDVVGKEDASVLSY